MSIKIAMKAIDSRQLADELRRAAIAYVRQSGQTTLLRRYVPGELSAEMEAVIGTVPSWMLVEYFGSSIIGCYPLTASVYEAVKGMYTDVPRLRYVAASNSLEIIAESEERR